MTFSEMLESDAQAMKADAFSTIIDSLNALRAGGTLDTPKLLAIHGEIQAFKAVLNAAPVWRGMFFQGIVMMIRDDNDVILIDALHLFYKAAVRYGQMTPSAEALEALMRESSPE